MRSAFRQGLTLVLVTHDPGVGAQCDRIVRMRDGLIVGEEHAAATRGTDAVPAMAAAD